MKRTLALPQALFAGAFTLVLATASQEASAEVYILQGEKGDQGDPGLRGDSGPKGDSGDTGPRGPKGDDQFTCTNGSCTLKDNQSLAINGSVTVRERPACPVGYVHDTTATEIVLCKKGADEMVRVGSFWIDRYEGSLWYNADCTGQQYGYSADDYPADFPDNGNWSLAVYACSKRGVAPSRWMTWFQGQQACELSGKQLCTNEEWQAAAAGTVDGAGCQVSAGGPRSTGAAGAEPGGATSCISRWGGEDMVGNVWEWVADWGQAGMTWQTGVGESRTPWPPSYGGDVTINVNSMTYNGVSFGEGGLGAPLRGGAWNGGSHSGVFTLAMNDAPSSYSGTVGLRCCLQQ